MVIAVIANVVVASSCSRRPDRAASTSSGARFAWDGNKQAGEGEITISDSAPPNRRLDDTSDSGEKVPAHGVE